MKIETLWKIIIKLFGIWFLIESLYIIPQFTQTISYINREMNFEGLIYTFVFLIASIVVYAIIIRFFLFKTEWIIEKLRLNQNYTEEIIDINIKSSTVITIAIIIIGGMTLVDSIPRLLSQIFEFLQQKILVKDYPKFSWIILQLLKSIFGYLLITKSKIITKYIEKESGVN